MAVTSAQVCKLMAADVFGTLVLTLVKRTVAAPSTTTTKTHTLMPRPFATPAPIAVGILVQTDARTAAAATGAATGLVARSVAIQTDVPSSSPITNPLIVTVLFVLVTIVIHPRITKVKTNV
jgi:hypothetical protein